MKFTLALAILVTSFYVTAQSGAGSSPSGSSSSSPSMNSGSTTPSGSSMNSKNESSGSVYTQERMEDNSTGHKHKGDSSHMKGSGNATSPSSSTPSTTSP